MEPKYALTSTRDIAERIIQLRKRGGWRDMSLLLKDNRQVAESTVNRFRVESGEGWIEAVNKLKYMGFFPRGMSQSSKEELIQRLKEKLKLMDEALSLDEGEAALDSFNLAPLMTLHIDEIMNIANARITENLITTPLDGDLSGFKIFYRQFDRGSKMDVYEPAGILTVEDGRYSIKPRPVGSLPPEVVEIFDWFRRHIIVKAVRRDDPHAKQLNRQVDEGYAVAKYCLGGEPSFVYTTFFKGPSDDADSETPQGVSLILQEPEFRGSKERILRPVYIGREGLVVVVQRRAPGTLMEVLLEQIRRNCEEAVRLKKAELSSSTGILSRMSGKGRARLEDLQKELKRLQATWPEEKQYIVGELYRDFKKHLAEGYGITDLDSDFQRNYSIRIKEGPGAPDLSIRDRTGPLVSFDFDQFRPMKGFNTAGARLPDVFETDVPPALEGLIHKALIKSI